MWALISQSYIQLPIGLMKKAVIGNFFEMRIKGVTLIFDEKIIQRLVDLYTLHITVLTGSNIKLCYVVCIEMIRHYPRHQFAWGPFARVECCPGKTNARL